MTTNVQAFYAYAMSYISSTTTSMRCLQAQVTVQMRVDLHVLFRPLLSGILEDVPSCLVGTESKVRLKLVLVLCTCHIVTLLVSMSYKPCCIITIAQ